jgi:hypothetical protein
MLIETSSPLVFEQAAERQLPRRLVDALLSTLEAGIFTRELVRAAGGKEETEATAKDERVREMLVLRSRVVEAVKSCTSGDRKCVSGRGEESVYRFMKRMI